MSVLPFLQSEVADVIPAPSVNQLIWHYTSAAGAEGILRARSLWLNSVSVLNDSEEMRHGMDLIRHQWSTHRDHPHKDKINGLLELAADPDYVDDLFVACASEAGSSLSQYRAYGSYALALNAGVPLRIRHPRSDDESNPFVSIDQSEAKAALKNGWRPVIYRTDEKVAQIERLFQVLSEQCESWPPTRDSDYKDDYDAPYMAEETAAARITAAAAYLKHEAFAEERELRLLCSIPLLNKSVQTRTNEVGITAYVEAESAAFGVDFLHQIRIGPGTVDPAAARAGVSLALRKRGYRDIGVELDAIPLRGSR